MNTSAPRAGRPALYTVQQAAWILGVSTDRIYRGIRTGVLPTVRRRDGYRVPAPALTQLLTTRAESAPEQSGGAP